MCVLCSVNVSCDPALKRGFYSKSRTQTHADSTCMWLKTEPTPVIYVSHTDIVCAAGWCIERTEEVTLILFVLSFHHCILAITIYCAHAPPPMHAVIIACIFSKAALSSDCPCPAFRPMDQDVTAKY